MSETKLERIYKQARCTCLKASALLTNILAIYNDKEPPHRGYEGSRTCPVHGPGELDDSS